MRLEYIVGRFEVKSLDDKGNIEGYGAAFGNVDDGRDIIHPGAFDETIAEHKAAGTMPAMRWEHDRKEPIGDWHEMTSDANGLLMKGRIWVGSGIPRAEQGYMMAKSKASKGFSIGYGVKDGGSRIDQKARVRHLTKLGVAEISLTSAPMNTKATIISVKSTDQLFKNADGTLITIREFERLLREGGLSETEAKTMLAGGYSRLVPRDGDKQSLLDVIKKYTPTV